MKCNYRYIIAVSLASLLGGCSIFSGLESIRQKKEINTDVQQARQKIAIQRSMTIKDSETSFSKPISCLSDSWLKASIAHHFFESQRAINQVVAQLRRDESLRKYINSSNGYNAAVSQEVAKKLQELHWELEKLGLKKTLFQKQIDKGFLSQKQQDEYIAILKRIAQVNDRISEYKSLQLALRKAAQSPMQKLRDGRGLFTFGVAPIYDKTGKIFTPGTTALSEFVAHALSYNQAINVIDTPYNDPHPNSSRVKISNLQSLQLQSIGHAFPTHFFISGALVQYDEGDVKRDVNSASLNLRSVQLRGNLQRITVGLVLRLVDSSNGMIDYSRFLHQDNDGSYKLIGNQDGNHKSNSIYLENTFFVQSMGGGLNRIISSKHWNIDIHTSVADPKNYAVREMVEKGVYELLKHTLPNYRVDYSRNSLEFTNFYTEAKQCDRFLPKH